jgi:hypothetical protein
MITRPSVFLQESNVRAKRQVAKLPRKCFRLPPCVIFIHKNQLVYKLLVGGGTQSDSFPLKDLHNVETRFYCPQAFLI